MKLDKNTFNLNALLLIYSLSSVCSKLAAGYKFFSIGFVIYYGLMIFILFAYAFGWQQVIKRMPLSKAYANKGITLIWGLLWGKTIFGETISWNKIVGVLVVLVGIIIYSIAGEQTNGEQ